jgi:hypothetical protein
MTSALQRTSGEKRRLHGALLGAALLGGMTFAACDFSASGLQEVAKGAAPCPNFTSVGAVMKFDWAGELGLDAKTALEVKGGVAASISLARFAARLDADLKVACGGMAKDLGKGAEFESGSAACKAAMEGLGELRGQIGGEIKIDVNFEPPVCTASVDAYANCVAECDVNVEPGSLDVKCEGGELVGKCDASCTGTCHFEAAATCEGTCSGACTADFKGTCGGECNGKCDGKTSEGASCAGTCEGSCTANAKGSCGGSCDGSCEMAAAGSCDGQCQGECTVDFDAPRCTGEIVPPKASADCDASCKADVQAEFECIPPKLAINIDSNGNAEAIAKYKTVLTTHLPGVLNIAVGMKDEAAKAAADVTAVVKGVKTTVGKLKSSGPQVAAKVTACVTAPFAMAVKAAASISASVSVSVDVSASASASGSASGSAG